MLSSLFLGNVVNYAKRTLAEELQDFKSLCNDCSIWLRQILVIFGLKSLNARQVRDKKMFLLRDLPVTTPLKINY